MTLLLIHTATLSKVSLLVQHNM